MRKLDQARIFILALTLTGSSLHGQSITLKQFLKSSLDDPYYKSFDIQQSFLQERNNYSLPWVEQMQFRYQDNQFDNYRTRYGLRLDPANPWQIKRNNRYFLGMHALKVIEQKMMLKEILFDRYEMFVDFWMAAELANLTVRQKGIREQIANTLGRKSGSADFDADQFLNAQLDVISKEADSYEANFKRDVAKSRLLSTVGATAFDLAITSLTDVDRINQIMQAETNVSSTELEFLKQRVEISNQKMNLEKSNFNVGYLQVMYNSDRQLDAQNSLGLAFGLTIPISHSNKENVAREKLDMIERQGELDQFQSSNKIKRLNSITQLTLHLDHFQKLDSLIISIKSKGMNLLAGLSNNYDPIIELKYQEKLVQLDILKVKIKKEVLLQYITLLDNSDKLHQRPLVNYLSNDLDVIE